MVDEHISKRKGHFLALLICMHHIINDHDLVHRPMPLFWAFHILESFQASRLSFSCLVGSSILVLYIQYIRSTIEYYESQPTTSKSTFVITCYVLPDTLYVDRVLIQVHTHSVAIRTKRPSKVLHSPARPCFMITVNIAT